MRRSTLSGLKLLAVTSCFAGLGCGEDCSAVGAACGGPITYAVVVESAPANLGALVVSIQTEAATTVTTTASSRSLPEVLDGTGSRRAVFLSPPASGTLATITYPVRPAATPAVLVLEAAANKSGGYATLAIANVRLRVEERASTP